ncbi:MULTISPECIES: riboflavin synthase [Amycolatopsis]|uniref:Riboflavin synthase n=2 Tax=Amycolatopsis japonica group TaxID=2893673 RepID=R4SP90_9PSEU|nr:MULTISPECIES: riboflavin synthase [Amycolatopsis]AGM05349.1 riboflavin synthase [Amycolatopsis keratiniphila]AIG77853.1 Riboflavin synthase [Amycolatopsis japonica]OKJ96207.1 riboflavin synthase subunit alpha [Amycolatopsis sp. CB00013]RSN35085.1 riboflavin synthase [Amycolatopsis sp. WAC 04169]
MFTGIVEELGEVTAVEQVPNAARLTVRGPLVTSDAGHGDSIAVSGVCLTVVAVAGGEFTVDVVHETLQRSSLAKVQVGDVVNLERATPAGGRLGGHIMQGHVDGTGVFLKRDEQGLTTFALPKKLSRYVVEKGSIAVDGVSLTVASVTDEEFSVALIPTTLELTTLGRNTPGDLVNLEVDVVAKYVEKLAMPHLRAQGDNGGTEERA